MENWDVSEWMQVGIKLPTALCASVFPLAVTPSFVLGVSRCWGRFERISSLDPRWLELILSLMLLLPWCPTFLSPSQPAGVGHRGQGWWQGWNHSQEQLLGRLELRVWRFELPFDGVVVDLHPGMGASSRVSSGGGGCWAASSLWHLLPWQSPAKIKGNWNWVPRAALPFGALLVPRDSWELDPCRDVPPV